MINSTDSGAPHPDPHSSAAALDATTAAAAFKATPQAKQKRDRSLPDRIVLTGLLCDSAVVLYSLLIAFWLRFQSPIQEYGVPDTMALRDYVGYIIFGALSHVFVLAWFGLYQRGTLLRYRFVSWQIVKGVMIWSAGFLLFTLVFRFMPPISRLYVGIAAAVSVTSLLIWRFAFHSFLQRSSAVGNLRQRIIFVGWNDESERLTHTFSSDAGSAYEVVGCVGPMRAGKFHRKPPTQVRILGDYQHIEHAIEHHGADIVVLTDMTSVKEDVIALANLCEREMVQFKLIPSYFQILVSGLHLETVSGIPIMGVSRLPLDRFSNIALKRGVDILGAVIGLILFGPLIALFALIVWIESPGPVFYRQRRCGLNGMVFDIIKIRSMKLDAEKGTGAKWCQKDDPRRLKIGAFMRKWNIDELPQFWNVLKGEMSLVGPRPERPELIKNFKHEIPHYQARHNAKPGMTGWAQVKGWRGDTDLGERINCDLWYMENWSLFLDFQIMFLTFFKRENAY
jgi:exopolysaccharide biosynthesis polyprenyl glycosylphosphotransferase